MKIKNLYTIGGLFGSNGKYIPEKNAKTVIAECVDDNIDHGCYYFAFLTYKQISDKKIESSLNFIEIPNLLTLMTKENIVSLKKMDLDANVLKKYETYVTESHDAKKELSRMDYIMNLIKK